MSDSPLQGRAPRTPRRLAWLLGGALFLFALPAAADTVEEGRQHFQRGVELHQDGDLKGALVEFRRANEVSPSFKILYNIGQTESELGNYLEAIRDLEQYLSSGGAQVPEERRIEISEELAKLRTRVGKIMVQSNAENAVLTIDGVSHGKLPIPAPIPLNAGRHTVVLQDGVRSRMTNVDIHGGETQVIQLAFPSLSSTLPPPKAHVVKSYAPMWVSFGIAGATAAGAVTFGVLAFSANQRHEDQLAKVHGGSYDASGKAGTVRAFAVTSDVFTSAAALATVVGVYFAIRPPSHVETTRVGIGPGSLSFTQQF